MIVKFTELAWEDFEYWLDNDKKITKKIRKLIKATRRTPTEGEGSPEALKHNLTGYWSRRINLEHRMVYKFTDDTLTIVQLRYHY
ncbi:Txe/YoeB family addiction module toxin [Vibrio nomapromontoriensis]|uniref:Txe/YoeB family addiction module toxin n=1 Tax=Vibrio nomapromontoriensis TaxID=2910246 RepID=UPI003D102117